MAKLLKAWKMIFGSRFCPHYQKYKISPQKDIDIWSKSFPCQPRTDQQREKYKTFFLEKNTSFENFHCHQKSKWIVGLFTLEEEITNHILVVSPFLRLLNVICRFGWGNFGIFSSSSQCLLSFILLDVYVHNVIFTLSILQYIVQDTRKRISEKYKYVHCTSLCTN